MSTRELDYDFNSPPGEDGLYRVVAEDGSVPTAGDEVTFGSDGLRGRGVVRMVYTVCVVELVSEIEVIEE